ncbi:unnamed protein product [Anisakis simplex]|uniref:Uncharacterized protein n=1 Tax=Anisakis simplex TaxID=6269 RepID=A0A0M3JJE4_ANISI|nr:unnamed protein product [Anisakis simplex]
MPNVCFMPQKCEISKHSEWSITSIELYRGGWRNSKLNKPGILAERMKFTEYYIEQPIDHANPSLGTWKQAWFIFFPLNQNSFCPYADHKYLAIG